MNYETLASEEVIQKTAQAIKKRGIDVIVVNNRQEALEKIKSMIPKGAEIMNASSTTLEQVGFVEYLKSGLLITILSLVVGITWFSIIF